MAVFLTTSRHTNVARASMARAAVEASNAALAFAMNQIFNSSAVGIATTTTQARTTASLTFTTNGQQFTKSSADNFWTLSGTVVAAGNTQKYALLIDGAGNGFTQEATQSSLGPTGVVWTNVNNMSSWGPILTMLNQNPGRTMVGYIVVSCNASTTFTPGTTALSAAGLTVSYINGIDPILLPLVTNEVNVIVGQGG